MASAPAQSDGAAPPPAKRARRHVTEELSIGRPRFRPDSASFTTAGGIGVERAVTDVEDPGLAVQALVQALDSRRGCIFESAYEYPGRYARWTMGFQDPPIVLEATGRRFALVALNERGRLILPALARKLSSTEAVLSLDEGVDALRGTVKPIVGRFTEEERSKQHSVFSVVRALTDLWGTQTSIDPQLGLYGAFGYDLTFQFEPVREKHKRDPNQRDLLLYLPDSVLVVDKQAKAAWRLEYDFEFEGRSTRGLPRDGKVSGYSGMSELPEAQRRDHAAGEYSESVRKAREEFKVGNLFECVLSQTFFEACPHPPSEIFFRLRERNPSPYMFVINLGEQEYLVGASPEMFVRVESTSAGRRVETCPISGTIRRGSNALEDADRIREILVNKKEESELTMCTDVDRNDKSRICEPGTVQVIGRRQIEKYSKLIHTVDHVEGYLRHGFDALDAFLVHTWAVTVTGAPKPWAIQFVEDNEKSPRCWYGGAVGLVGFDGSLNTGLTLRTIRLKGGIAEVRAGATLLYDSVPEDEEKETELKASAFREAVLHAGERDPATPVSKLLGSSPGVANSGSGRRVLLVDHQDSFVHTLANYFRQTGAEVVTVRFGLSEEELKRIAPDLVVLSPGPGKPSDFKCGELLGMLAANRLPAFGVCLGLQAMVEHYGGKLGVLPYPQHGKPADVKVVQSSAHRSTFAGIPSEFQVARYHSLYALADALPPCLRATAHTADGVIMAIEHVSLPLAAVQFHPESILTNPKFGLTVVANAFLLAYD